MRLTPTTLRQIIKEELHRSARTWIIKESTIEGRGVFANSDLPANTPINIVAIPGFQDRYVITEFGGLINHQALPNCELRIADDGCYWLYTLSEVRAGIELVSDYRAAPPHHINSFLGFIER